MTSMEQKPPLTEKLRWLLIVTAIGSSIPMYGVVAMVVGNAREQPPDPSAAGLVRPLLYVVALVAIAAGLYWMPRVAAGTPRSSLPPPQAFAVASMIALALLEAGALVGFVLFFLTGRVADFAVLAGASLAGLLLYAVPQGLRYFAAREGGDGAAPPLSPG